jgi:flotillin
MLVGFLVGLVILFLFSLKRLYHTCGPNQVLVISGRSRRRGEQKVGYRIIKGGSAYKLPFVEKIDRIDLTNMIIEITVPGGYSKGGVPLNVHGVANVKIAGHEPVLGNAIERFLSKSRAEVMAIAKATLEGSLRGVLATMTPEEMNEDRAIFEEKLLDEAQEIATLGLEVDTLKIQNITDDVRYLDSIGRIRNAELVSSARKAEATARADSLVRAAENREREFDAKTKADIDIAKAQADRKLTDARTRRDALVAEENAQVAALVAKAESDVEVQKARIEQVRRRLEADVVAPSKAACEAAEQEAQAKVAPIAEEGRARAEALLKLAQSWSESGDKAREIFLLQKLEPIIDQLTETISDTHIERVTMIDSGTGGGNGKLDPRNLYAWNEQIKEVFGVDLVDKIKGQGENGHGGAGQITATSDGGSQEGTRKGPSAPPRE